MDKFVFWYGVSEWAISLFNCLDDLTNEPKKIHRRLVWEHHEPKFKKTLNECLQSSFALTEPEMRQLFYQLRDISPMMTTNVDLVHLSKLAKKTDGLIKELQKIGALKSCEEWEADFCLRKSEQNQH
jgi:hypothetical protein